ncbi:MAG: hypothetical protein JO202_12225 [Ktedonobacteraceae bacterium]|nr:hypothetical protein [Ktedonobacteraceae bacterium]
MLTLEQRIAALERALSTLRAEHISDIRQLEERINARISALQQQIDEQQRRLSEHEQAIRQIGQADGPKI